MYPHTLTWQSSCSNERCEGVTLVSLAPKTALDVVSGNYQCRSVKTSTDYEGDAPNQNSFGLSCRRWCTFSRVWTCNATQWGPTQAEDEAEKARRHQIKAWEASKVCYRGQHQLVCTCPGRRVRRRARFSKRIDGASASSVAVTGTLQVCS